MKKMLSRTPGKTLLPPEDEERKGFSCRRLWIFLIFAAIHAIVILGPAGCFWLAEDEDKQKEIAFRVDLGGLEPSHAPEVGEPERLRPGNTPPPPEPEAVPEPPKPEPPKPEPPKPEPPKPEPPKPEPPKPEPPKPEPPKPKPPKPKPPKPDPAKIRKQQADAARKRKIEESNRRNAEIAKKRKADEARKRKIRESNQRNAEIARKRRENSVYHDPNAAKFDPDKKYTGGTNFNKNVKMGKRDAGQKKGAVDGRTPAGGADKGSEKEWEAFSATLSGIIEDKWDEPPGVLINEQTAAVIAIRVDRNGIVIGKKVVKVSPNPAVTASARALLAKLNTLPRPPGNSATGWIEIVLIPEGR